MQYLLHYCSPGVCGGASAAGSPGVTLAALDLWPSLAVVAARTLVARGEKDEPHLADSREIVATIPGASFA